MQGLLFGKGGGDIHTGEYSPESAATFGATGAADVRPRTDQALSMIAWVDSPYLWNRYGPDSYPSAKVSRRPIRRSGRPSPASAIASATAEPRPPMMEWVSRVSRAFTSGAMPRTLRVAS